MLDDIVYRIMQCTETVCALFALAVVVQITFPTAAIFPEGLGYMTDYVGSRLGVFILFSLVVVILLHSIFKRESKHRVTQ